MNEQNLVIIGGGFAGITLARKLEKKLPRDWTITLLSKENYITYNPLLAEAVGASILPSHVTAPLRQMVKRSRFYMVHVTEVALDRREIFYLGEGPGVIRYDQLVLACGVRANLNIIPGMDRYGLPLKTLGDALFLRNHIMARLEHADMQRDPELRRWLSHFIVVGGGFSGVELTGEISDYLREAVRFYPSIDAKDCRITLLHNTDRILPEMSVQSSRFAFKRMCRQGVDIRLNASVVRANDRGVLLGSGETVTGGTVICTIGTAPLPLIESLAVPKQRGRIATAPDMSVPDYPGLWAIGDCAAIVNAHGGRLSPPTAQFATRQATQLAHNIQRALYNQQTRAFYYKPQGQLSSIGRNKAVAEVFGLRFYGFLGWLLWRGVYLLKLPTLSRKVRVFMEWNWGMLFPPDIVHLRYTRSKRSTPADTPKTDREPGQSPAMNRRAALGSE